MAYIYITSLKLKNESASATRILSFCNILQNDLNKEVLVLSLDESIEKKFSYKGLNVITLRGSSGSLKARFLNFLCHVARLKKTLRNDIKNQNIEGIFFYSLPLSSVLYLKKISKKYRINLFHDSVEWYSWQQFRWGKLALPYIAKNILNKYLIDKEITVFSISTYLNDYYLAKGIKSKRLPIILDVNKVKYQKELKRNKIKLVYAGSPGKKDYLKEIIEGISFLDNNARQGIQLEVYGVTKSQLIDVCSVPLNIIEKCGDSIIIKGRVAKQEVERSLIYADFTVLLRSPDLVYAKAGFPTKVVESLAAGTPIICNLSSDLGLYLKDGLNSLIVEDCDSYQFCKTLERALTLTFEEKERMCLEARRTAEENFHYSNYINHFKSLIND